MLTINICSLNDDLLPGLIQLEQAGLLALTDDGMVVEAVKNNHGLSVKVVDGKATIGYSRTVHFFRGISYLIQGVASVNEQPAFTDNGYMLDCSRNAVSSIAATKKLIRHMALMGLSTLQLYTEDTYELPEWQYFGYQRGRYTASELQELDQYAILFGIELIPCIQTLAHLNAALRWNEFRDIIDCDDILLVGDEKTHKLIEDMIRQLSSCFTTRRIHIGMDEAHMLGLGKYLQRHGYQNRSEIMCNHLARVIDICSKYGLKPMMWSDMFFRLAYGGEYYGGGDEPLPPETLKLLRPEVGLVYWDYYSKDKEHYASMLKKHKNLPNDLIFAGGAWKWSGILPELQYSEDTTRAALSACRDMGITEIFATSWGDDGAECPAFSILPTLQLYAELDYQGDVGNEVLQARFKACTGGNFNDFYLLDKPNNTTETRRDCVNTTKPLLYQDVLHGLFDKHVDGETFPAHFVACAEELAQAADRNGEWGYMFSHAAAICRLLAGKSTIGLEITAAYLEDDKCELRRLAEVELPKLQKLTDEVIYGFERQWEEENKPHGLEVIHIRLGGVRVRLEASARRILDYVWGKIERIEELESERLGFNGPIAEGADINANCNQWQNIASASRMSW